MKLLNRLQSFQQENFLCDAIIVSNSSTEYKVHSVILAAISPIFEEAFRSNPTSGIKYINLPSIDDETMLILVNSLYSGKLTIPNYSSLTNDISNQIERISLNLKELGIDRNSFDSTEINDFNNEYQVEKLKIEVAETKESIINEIDLTMPSILLCKYCNLPFESVENLSVHDCLQKEKALNRSKVKRLNPKIRIKNKIKRTFVEQTADNLGIILLQENQPFNLTKDNISSNLKLYSNLRNLKCKNKNSKLNSFNKRKPPNVEPNKDLNSFERFNTNNLIGKDKIEDLFSLQDDDNFVSNSADNLNIKRSHNNKTTHSERKTRLPNYLSEYISEYETGNASLTDEHPQDDIDFVNKSSRNIKNTSNRISNEFLDNVSENQNANMDFELAECISSSQNGKGTVVCELCGLRLKKYSLTSHMETMHQRDNSKYPCSECDLVFHTGHRRHMHIIKEHKKVPHGHLCELCGRCFDNNTSIYYHMYKHKKEEEEAVIKKIMKAGMNVKKEEIVKEKKKKSLQCQHCQQTFIKSSILRHHINKTHFDVTEKLDLPFKCDYCDKEFDYKSQYVTHVAIHKDERAFVCPHCGKGFKNRVGIHYHLRIHSTETRFKCKECGQGFKLSHHLKQHMAHHTTIRPFKCDICEKAYKAKFDLKNHLKHCHRIDSSKNFMEISRELKLFDYITEEDMLQNESFLF